MKEVKPAGYKTKGAAKYLNISEKKVRDLSDTGAIKCLRIGRDRYFPVEALDEFIASLPKWGTYGNASQA
jgi:excisionase family DNA binding protein